jgi:hypothetical protein
MSEETETPDPKAFERFRRLAKKVVSVPKLEIDKRTKEWREAREAERTEIADDRAYYSRERTTAFLRAVKWFRADKTKLDKLSQIKEKAPRLRHPTFQRFGCSSGD